MTVVDIDPVALHIGHLEIYWYGILFAISLVIAWAFSNAIVKRTAEVGHSKMTLNQLDKFLFGAILVTVIAARLGHVLFFEPGYYFTNPIEIVMLRRGGLSFHGGLIGLMVYVWFYSRNNNVPKLFLADTLCFSASVALITGRMANFVNQELVGKVWASEYGVVFKAIDSLPRYPTQIYEAMTEGLLTFAVLSVVLRCRGWLSIGTGVYTALFCVIYSSSRFAIEFFKDVDTINFCNITLTIGQILCIGMFIFGICIATSLLRKCVQNNN